VGVVRDAPAPPAAVAGVGAGALAMRPSHPGVVCMHVVLKPGTPVPSAAAAAAAAAAVPRAAAAGEAVANTAVPSASVAGKASVAANTSWVCPVKSGASVALAKSAGACTGACIAAAAAAAAPAAVPAK
jgi:hypothetical protein